MLKCQHCNEVIRDGDLHKVVSVSLETREDMNATLVNEHRDQICCMLCELELEVDSPQYGIEKPAAMAGWSSYDSSVVLSFGIISPARQVELAAKLRRLESLNDWWDYLTGVEQHVISKVHYDK